VCTVNAHQIEQKTNVRVGAIVIPLNYLAVSAIARGMSLEMALNLIPIMNAAR